MAQVKGTVLIPFNYKGKQYQADDEISMPAGHAARFEKLDYVKFDREAEKKIEKEKNEKAGPNAPKTKN